jgi:hypothetical protein
MIISKQEKEVLDSILKDSTMSEKDYLNCSINLILVVEKMLRDAIVVEDDTDMSWVAEALEGHDL